MVELTQVMAYVSQWRGSGSCYYHGQDSTELKVKVKVSLENALKAQRASRGITHSFFSLEAIWRWLVKSTPPVLPP